MSANLSQSQINRRKQIQGGIARTTGALGIAALATRAGAKAPAAAAARGGKLKALGKYTPDKMKDVSNGLATGSAGLAGLGSFNFASYTSAEAAKKKRVQKNDEMAPMAGEVGIAKRFEEENSTIAKDWQPSASNYDPEVRRQKRAGAYEKGAAALGITGGAVGTASFGSQVAGKGLQRRADKQAMQASKLGADAADLKARRKKSVPTRDAAIKLGAKATKNAKTAGKLKGVSTKAGIVAGTAGAGGFAANTAIRRKRKSSWESYAKSATSSAFGITHD